MHWSLVVNLTLFLCVCLGSLTVNKKPKTFVRFLKKVGCTKVFGYCY